MTKFLKIPMEAPKDEVHIVQGVNAKGKNVYLCKYVTNGKQTFAWLEEHITRAHPFRDARIAKLAAEECDTPAYNAPADGAFTCIVVPAISPEEWDSMVANIVASYLDHIEVIETP